MPPHPSLPARAAAVTGAAMKRRGSAFARAGVAVGVLAVAAAGLVGTISGRRPGPSVADTLAAAIAMIAAPAMPAVGGAPAAARGNGGGRAAAGLLRLGRRGGR
jgi:hypothetical protein